MFLEPHPGCNLAEEVSWMGLVCGLFQLWLSKAPYDTEFLTTRGPNMSISIYRPSTESIGFILKWIPGKHRGQKLLDENLWKYAVSRKFGIHN
jgi:hypothetical protein